jgi:hypothetical protein
MVGTSVAVVTIGASIVLPVAGAAGDQIGTTKAQLAAMESRAVAGAAQIHQLTLVYEQANLTVATLNQQVSADQSQVSQLQSQVSSSASLLRREAILSYTGATSNTLVMARKAIDPSVGAEYLQVATGDVNDNIDQYRTQQQQLSSAQELLIRQVHAGQAASQAASAARQRLLAEAAAEQAQINRLQQQLSREIELAAIAAARQRAEAAARAAARANAQAAARAAARANAQAAAQKAAAPRPQPASTQGLPVNNGLVNVVRAIVAAPVVRSAPAPVVRSAPAPRPPPVTAPPPPPPSSSGYTPLGGVWLELRQCESGDNYAINTGNGFYGAYQFTLQTWVGLGYSGLPSTASPRTQDSAAVRLQAEAGWGQWPVCSAMLGLR